MRLADFKELTFDCYGTLIDWESGMIAALRPLTAKVPGLTPDRLLAAHARHEAAQQTYTPAKLYRDLLPVVYKRLAEEWDVGVSWDECLAYGRSVGNWPAFPDSAAALAYLKGHYRLVILSNTDNQSFALSNLRLDAAFDAVITAEDVGSYKPALRNFDYMLEKLKGMGLAKDHILHTAESLFHDHGPANAQGLASCWIHRRHGREGFGATADPGQTPNYNFYFKSMADFVEAHRKETGA